METVKPSEIRRGDVIVAHGLRVLIDTDPDTFPGSYGGLPVTSVLGLVLNRDDVPTAVVPWSFTAQTTGWPTYTPTGDHRWRIQGNDNARFSREEAPTC